MWNQVGLDGDEILLIHEGKETRMYIISDRTGAAIWSRIDGKNSVEDIENEMVHHGNIAKSEASRILSGFLAALEQHALVQKNPSPADMEEKTGPSHISWPNPISSPVLSPFHLEEFVSQDLVALGSFQGALNNTSGHVPCHSGEGGVNDVGGHGPCRPGPGHGFLNAGIINVPCS